MHYRFSRMANELRNNEPSDFDVWMSVVDSHVRRKTGLSLRDLPDYLYRDAYDEGCDPVDVAVDVIEQACKCFGFDASMFELE